MRIPRACLFVALLAAPSCLAGETPAGQAQPYEKIRYPTFANGRLQTMLEADQAEAYDLAEATPRINLLNVVVTLYDHSSEALARTPDDQPLPARMIITSDRGFFTRRPPAPGETPEEIANLEGNVVMRQMRGGGPPKADGKPRRLDPSIETEIHCQHAQWNNTLRKLNGDGEVEFIQEDSRIVGTGFLYLADDEALNPDSDSSNIKDWGGIVFIEHNARMEIDREAITGQADRTVITCKDTASYKLREREIQFERDVRVRRADLLIESDILKVYLRREDDPQPAAMPNAGMDEPVPGMVRTIVATIGKRPGSVVITGFEPGPGGAEAVKYIGKGGRADLDYDANRITLTDSRLERMPEVEFAQGKFTDRSLDFIFTRARTNAGNQGGSLLNTLNATGGQGQVILRQNQGGPSVNPQTEVNYKTDMVFSRDDNRIRFRGSVFLKRGDLRIRSETLDVRLAPNFEEAGGDAANAIERIIAETDVSILSGGREARAQRAEYDIIYNPDAGQYLDTLKLYGPPQRTPPHPWIRDETGNQINAPIIIMQRLQTGPREKPRHLLVGMGGVSVCDFFTSPSKLGERGKVISIKCENGMEYNESTQTATFLGQVQAASDAPEDNYVLTSDRLDIRFVERPNPDSPDESVVILRRINASGNARFMQDTRVCEASQIIRDFPTERLDEGDIYLEGFPAQEGRAARPAVYREQNGQETGALFAAPRIMASANGDMIRANGPGQLSIPDEIPGFRADVNFEGAALYESYRGGVASEAKFRQRVVLRQPSRNLTITAEELDTRFIQIAAAPPRRDDEVNIERIGRLNRAEGRVNVRLEHNLAKQGTRVATGDKCVVEFTDTGNAITMSVDRQRDPRRWVMVRDYDGLTLRAPQVDVRDQQGVTRASGPGELFIPGGRVAADNSARTPTRIIYGERGQMVYNELALNIRANDNVRIIQPGQNDNWSSPSVDGRCNAMEITLLEPPTQGMNQDDALSRAQRMVATGAVVLRVYADPAPENPNADWTNRPDTTFFTRGDTAVYEVPEGRITISADPGRQPQLLLNMADAGRTPRRQRLKADRFILNTNTMPRRWYFDGQLESNTLHEGEPFDFTN